ncbi:MAG: tyrosine-type recombinase/integrase [Candidatus Thermoplasmatota archaeon]|nr:tyrosine-type recombinase/integrase [Candidatus Thermoplasmatota archaeon]
MENLNINIDIENIIKQIKNPVFMKEIEDYLRIRERVDKVALCTRRNDAQAFLALDKFLVKNKIDYKKITRDQMIEFEVFLQKDLELSAGSMTIYEIHIKKFYKYLSNKDEYCKGKRFQKSIPYPDCVSWISASINQNGKLPIDDVIDYDGIMRMINVCDNIRDQAMVITFIDAGLRNSELVSLNVENLGFDKLGAYLILSGDESANLKTGQRKIRLFLVPSSTQYLKEYINKHPFKQYPKAPLFYSRDNKFLSPILKKANSGTVIKEDFEDIRLHRLSVKDIIKKIGRLANVPITKPHDLRHNSCTMCARKGFNEMELRIRYGWSPTSKMPSRYTHLAGKDLDDKIKVITGFKEPEKPKDEILQPIMCWNCNSENLPSNAFCFKCGANLKPKKEEITGLTATDLGVAVQKGMDKDQVEEITRQVLINLLKEYDLKKKET